MWRGSAKRWFNAEFVRRGKKRRNENMGAFSGEAGPEELPQSQCPNNDQNMNIYNIILRSQTYFCDSRHTSENVGSMSISSHPPLIPPVNAL
jgi:hypothetical protein